MPRIIEEAHVINLDDKQRKGTHWVSLFIDRNTAVYKIKDKSMTHNIFGIQSDDSIMCWFYCIAFIEYMIAGKAFLDYTNLFSPNDWKKDDKIIYKYLKDKYGKAKRKPWL